MTKTTRRPYEAIHELLKLPENWDSYGAKPVSREAAKHALRFGRSLPADIPIPDIAPSPDGGILFEWGNCAVGLWFDASGNVIVAADDFEDSFRVTDVVRVVKVLRGYLP